MRRLALALLVAAVAASAALVTTSPAAAATPCWRLVINDWYDNGKIDRTYPIHCYRDALKNLPQDILSYADAPDVINAAMQTAIVASQKDNGGSNSPGGTPAGTDTTGTTPGDTATETGTDTTKTTAAGPGGTDTTGGSGPGGHDASPVPKVITNIGPSSASSVPVPLIILGVLALLLLAAGAAGVVARKLQERRLPATPGGTPPSDPPATA